MDPIIKPIPPSKITGGKKVNAAQLMVQSYINDNSENSRQRWEELNDIYMACQSGMLENLQYHERQLQVFKVAQVSTARFNMLVAQYTKDVEQLFSELESIFDMHKDKKGHPKHSGEYTEILSIAEQYNVFRARMMGTIMHFNTSMTEEYLTLQAMMRHNQETDVSVTTDAVVKND
jgi:hypothetical protein